LEKQIAVLKEVTYKELCKEVGIDTLERRRYLQDMAHTYPVPNMTYFDIPYIKIHLKIFGHKTPNKEENIFKKVF
jgi:hypothetical protein